MTLDEDGFLLEEDDEPRTVRAAFGDIVGRIPFNSEVLSCVFAISVGVFILISTKAVEHFDTEVVVRRTLSAPEPNADGVVMLRATYPEGWSTRMVRYKGNVILVPLDRNGVPTIIPEVTLVQSYVTFLSGCFEQFTGTVGKEDARELMLLAY